LNVVVTLDTFFGERFQQQLKKLKSNYLLVVDECHTWGTNTILSNLPNALMRLGLSATPELHFSEIKTHKLLEYFGGIVSKYSIEDAMNEDKLVRYNYYPIIVSLNDIEREQYSNLTQKIIKSLGYDPGEMGDPEKNPFLEQLLFKRSRIIYGANNKLNKLLELVNNLKNVIDQNFKNQLIKEQRVETFDSKWKAARQNIERYLQQIASQNVGLEKTLLSDRFFLYEDVAALLIDLLWQDLHEQLEIKETLHYYKYYKIQISEKNLLTWNSNQ
jgi:superfamily II DNA or RNA helicase